MRAGRKQKPAKPGRSVQPVTLPDAEELLAIVMPSSPISSPG